MTIDLSPLAGMKGDGGVSIPVTIESADTKPTDVSRLTVEQQERLAAALVRIRSTQTLRNWIQYRVYSGDRDEPSTVRLLRYSHGRIAQTIDVWGP